ncbi:hypothetical protein GUITHDRAFT_153585 [Guillardia theta CCMP2712]|uniref:PDZ domain-containing protein n=2 Tax=Guillardia theta TaxID=55529 RepID=L1J2I1_GUITC|nr:hypothetical protein GUITHDRAFT_153585 [Guillardia theta CCMP2712]EKX42329.1 hypothetical protein GUITHDRAFT_153585 [Guillardia theta CCMP2712]|eukprot:XP_005829309.1 hypothetical protein GUITHDRAFT_153585 [Guillardia theta CCMP2712]
MFSNFKFSSDRKQDTQSNNPRQGGGEGGGEGGEGGGEGGKGKQEGASVKPLSQGGQTEGSNSEGLKEEAKGDGEEQGRADGHEGNGGGEGEGLEEGRPAFGIGLVLESWKPSNLSRALNLIGNTREAVKVHSVLKEGSAAKAHPAIYSGDILTHVEEVKITSLQQARRLLRETTELHVKLKFVRNQIPYETVIDIDRMPVDKD